MDVLLMDTFVPAHNRRPTLTQSKKSLKTLSKADWAKDQATMPTPKSIFKGDKAAKSASSHSTQSVTFDKSVDIPDVVKVSSSLSQEKSHGTQSKKTTPSGTPSNPKTMELSLSAPGSKTTSAHMHFSCFGN